MVTYLLINFLVALIDRLKDYTNIDAYVDYDCGRLFSKYVEWQSRYATTI